MVGLSQIGSIVTSLGLSTGPYVNKEIRGSVAGAYSFTGLHSFGRFVLMIGGCGILLLTKLGGYLFDTWTAGAPFYIMAILNGVALVAAVVVILMERWKKVHPEDDGETEPLLANA